MKEKEKENPKKIGETSKDICRHYMRGICRYGMLGKTQRDGVSGCAYSHPRACRKWMDNLAVQKAKTAQTFMYNCARSHLDPEPAKTQPMVGLAQEVTT